MGNISLYAAHDDKALCHFHLLRRRIAQPIRLFEGKNVWTQAEGAGITKRADEQHVDPPNDPIGPDSSSTPGPFHPFPSLSTEKPVRLEGTWHRGPRAIS